MVAIQGSEDIMAVSSLCLTAQPEDKDHNIKGNML
jgi:hypothetical protein